LKKKEGDKPEAMAKLPVPCKIDHGAFLGDFLVGHAG